MRAPILTLLAVFALAACGSEGSSTEEWAREVCGALAAWQGSLEERAQTLTGDVLQSEPAESKRLISDFLDEVVATTETMRAEVEAAGVPAVEDGEAIAGDFRAGLRQIQDAFVAAQEDVEAVPTDDPEAFQRELTQTAEELEQQGDRIAETLSSVDEEYGATELGEALAGQPGCADFRG